MGTGGDNKEKSGVGTGRGKWKGGSQGWEQGGDKGRRKSGSGNRARKMGRKKVPGFPQHLHLSVSTHLASAVSSSLPPQACLLFSLSNFPSSSWRAPRMEDIYTIRSTYIHYVASEYILYTLKYTLY